MNLLTLPNDVLIGIAQILIKFVSPSYKIYPVNLIPLIDKCSHTTMPKPHISIENFFHDFDNEIVLQTSKIWYWFCISCKSLGDWALNPEIQESAKNAFMIREKSDGMSLFYPNIKCVRYSLPNGTKHGPVQYNSRYCTNHYTKNCDYPEIEGMYKDGFKHGVWCRISFEKDYTKKPSPTHFEFITYYEGKPQGIYERYVVRTGIFGFKFVEILYKGHFENNVMQGVWRLDNRVVKITNDIPEFNEEISTIQHIRKCVDSITN